MPIFTLNTRQKTEAAGLDPCPQRAGSTWDEFLQRHVASLWQSDFFSQKTLTLTGFKEVFVLVFLPVKTRRVILSPATFHPNNNWMATQAESFANQARKLGLPITYVQRDRDKKFAKVFDGKLKSKRIKVIKNPPRSPNTNAFVERFILSIKAEALHHFVVLGEQHLNYLCQEFISYYHDFRPHQSLDNEPPTKPKQRGRPKSRSGNIKDEIIPLSEIRCHKRLGGLLNSYSRKAA